MVLKTSVHSTLVRALAKKYEKDGYTVQADGIGHLNGSPNQVGGYVPDIVARKAGAAPIIAEAEVCGSISSKHTREQWTAFSNAYGSRFHIIVPKKCIANAKQQARQWGISVDKWLTYRL
jgi:hypothetical protein